MMDFLYDHMNELLFLAGGILCGILFGLAIAQHQQQRRQKKLDAIRPNRLGYDPGNPMNQRSGNRAKIGEPDEYGFIRLG